MTNWLGLCSVLAFSSTIAKAQYADPHAEQNAKTAAEHVFADEGIEAAKIDCIVAQAQVSKNFSYSDFRERALHADQSGAT